MQSIIFYNNSEKILGKLEEKFGKDLEQSQISFLETRPWWNKSHVILQINLNTLIPGTHLVAHPGDELTIFHLVVDTETKTEINIKNSIKNPELRIVDNDLIIHKMQSKMCHHNAKRLLEQKKIKELHSGLALSNDRLWREHSWGVDFDGKIVETTVSRLAYLSGEKYI